MWHFTINFFFIFLIDHFWSHNNKSTTSHGSWRRARKVQVQANSRLAKKNKKLRKTIMPHSRSIWPSKEPKPIYPPISLFWKDLSLLIFFFCRLCVVLLVLDNIGSAQEMWRCCDVSRKTIIISVRFAVAHILDCSAVVCCPWDNAEKKWLWMLN